MNRMRFALVLLLGAAWLGMTGPSGLAAQPAPLGPEGEVPTDVFPRKPFLAVQPGGDSMVGFDDFSPSYSSVFYRFLAAGSMPSWDDGWYSIESPDSSPETVAVTATPRGFDLLWRITDFVDDKATAFYRGHFDLKGQPEGEPVRVGRAGTDWVWQVRGNGFVAGWALPKAHGIAARRLTSTGQTTGPELRLNSRPVDSPHPLVMAVADSGFLAVWLGTARAPGAPQVLRARRFSPAGKPLGTDFDVNTVPLDGSLDLQDPSAFLVSAAPGGGFAVAWWGGEKNYLRFFDAAGKALGPEAPAAIDDGAFLVSMAFDDVGNLLLLWVLDQGRDDHETDLKIRLLDPQGAPLGPPESVISEASDIFRAPWDGSVAWAEDSWIVAWVAAGLPAGDFDGIFVRRFAAH